MSPASRRATFTPSRSLTLPNGKVCHPSRLHALIRHCVATSGKLSLKPKPSADSEEDLAAPAISSWGECRASGDGGRSLSPAAAAGSKSSSLAVWSGSNSDVHGKPRQTFLDKLCGVRPWLVKDECSNTVLQLIGQIILPKQLVEDNRSGFGLTLGPHGEIVVVDPRLLADGRLRELTYAINSMLAECFS